MSYDDWKCHAPAEVEQCPDCGADLDANAHCAAECDRDPDEPSDYDVDPELEF